MAGPRRKFMKECFVCGREATIYAEKKWWCERHYLIKKRNKELRKGGGTSNEDLPKIDLGLAKI